MANPPGFPIWYELLTADPAGAKAFYDTLFGWTVAGPAACGVDYRMIDTAPDGAGGDFVGGMMPLTPAMQAGGAKPGWLFYLGVDDVDPAAERVAAAGGGVLMAPFDIPGAGRAALVADPQGNPFYVMRGSSEGYSAAFRRTGMGKCNWNELSTPDAVAGNAFYAEVFGWVYPGRMPMPGDLGDYTFVQAGDETIGATMRSDGGNPPGWRFYFRAPDIHAAAAQIRAAGGTVHQEPMEVPGGDWVLIASDPEGIRFGVAAPGRDQGA